ncbi:acyl carrier protein [Streptomyces aidingensis]|uniref:Act minimal PKS acyl carrier protein/minimal PKS acyl carrier protein n=1 Tax=Streptomyces aidingensis TaxID=910347 RepID=A0A1I1LC31_9ACTN|nr:acyl carrier protein [Streptomyces aidingensis]SFC70697.1 act minimal PKS acyl carrier protein/minimal PKS acyl carrier protein [Streptomyces aidingensis]
MASETLPGTFAGLTEDGVRDLLRAVGLGPETVSDAAAFATSFEDLGLDSLARVETASRIKERFGVDIEEELTAETTPEEMRRLVKDRLAASPSAPAA